MRVLYINNDADSAADVCSAMDKHYLLDVAHDGEEGAYLSQVNDYAAIVVESGDSTQAKLCRSVREEGSQTPILVLLSKDDLPNKLVSLEYGADAVLTKPVDSQEVLAYLRNMIQRACGSGSSRQVSVGEATLDFKAKEVFRRGQRINLSRKEFAILECLMLNKGRIVSKEKLLEQAWEHGFETLSNTLEVHIKSLRDKIDRPFKKKLIKTVYGFGYKIEE